MFDLGWSEMMVIGVVALIVVGPKELPGLFRQIGVWVGKARGVAREFSRAMESAADETGLKDIDRTIRAAANPVKFGTSSLKSAALGDTKVPAAGTPLTLGPEAQALAQKQAENRTALAQAAAERRAAEADRRAADAERRAAEAERRAIEAEKRASQTDEPA